MTKPPATRHPLHNRRAFRNALLDWFDQNGPDYPWRQTADPYAILVSEIMLQQTTVAAVTRNNRFERFLAAFPTLESLAAAPEQKLLRAWEGLGYYQRARNLRKTARALLDRHHGDFPRDPALLEALPGIGPYTAAALAAFAFNQPVPAVDANVARVLARLFDHAHSIDSAPSRRQLRAWAAALLAPDQPRRFTSALMDLGQSLCRTAAPRCRTCPVRTFCTTRRPDALPVRKARRGTVEVTEHVLFVRRRDGALLLARESGSRRRGLWRLPERPPEEAVPFRLLATHVYNITHHKVTLHIHRCPPASVPPAPADHVERFHPPHSLNGLPMPSPFRQALHSLL